MGLAGCQYGSGGSGEWFGEYAGFVFRGVQTPEGMGCAIQPLWDLETGLVVLLDGRVDGRAALIAACRAAGYPARTPGDAELVLRAYQAWGEECPCHILGEYAFILWDSFHGRLIAARDSAGLRPLFYAQTPDGLLRLATGANQLLSDPAVPRKADIAGMLDFVIGRGFYDPHRTPCASIQRLPAAHTLIADARGVRLRQYWSIEDEGDGNSTNWNESVEACTSALLDAIRDRTSICSPVGLSLSGGWDSGAIFALWQWMRSRGEDLASPWTHTYYDDDPAADERAEVQELLRQWPASSTIVHRPRAGLLDGLDTHVEQLGMPDFSPGWRIFRQQGAAAREAGVNTLLTGDAGNTVFQSSMLKSVDLLCRGRLPAARRQARLRAAEIGASAGSLGLDLVKTALLLRVPTIRRMGLWARGAVMGRRSNLRWLTASAQGTALELMAPLNARRRGPAPGQKLAMWGYRAGLADLSRDLFVSVPALDLEGVAASSPYMDRRVQRTALAAIVHEPSPSPSRELLGSVLERTVGRRLPGNYAHVTAHIESGLLQDLRAGNDLFQVTALRDLGIVASDQGASPLTEQTLRQYSFGTIWRLLALEAWARKWLIGL